MKDKFVTLKGDEDNAYHYTDRQRVPGGWLLRTYYTGEGVHTVFIPRAPGCPIDAEWSKEDE